jgi:putative Mn2+ efflux pump MntP
VDFKLWLGYFLGTTFEGVVTNIDHWIAFILLSIIGIKMVKESFSKEIKNYNDDVSFKTMLIL